ncbi:MAG: zinc ribbon domain-containing protein [Nitrososphaerota archaeon]|nr:zinc ribbon domain-containing protein [Candidatus Bathyarchaeota archaeon]MDW8048803.1 zinc ribbon domain-containing protein [Nitrososphaerota archaeon]
MFPKSFEDRYIIHVPSVGRVMGEAFRIYVSQPAVFYLPFLLTNIAVIWIVGLAKCFLPSFTLTENFSEEFLISLINYLSIAVPIAGALTVAIWTFYSLPYGIATACTHFLIGGREMSLRKSLGLFLSNVWSVLMVSLAYSFLVVVGTIFLIFPGLYAFVLFSLSVQVAVIEDAGVIVSFRRSRKLASNYWMRVFLILALTYLMYGLGYLVGNAVAGENVIARWLIVSVITSIMQPLQPISMTYLYHMLRKSEETLTQVELIQSVPVAFNPRFCYKCGQRLPIDAIYCPNCGVKVRE